MSAANNGGQAFPMQDPRTVPTRLIPGMTLRDYFIAQRLAELMRRCREEQLEPTYADLQQVARGEA